MKTTNCFPQIFSEKEMLLRRLKELREEGYYIADLHVHSAQSDGIHSLKSIAAHCLELGILVAVTDHNRIPDLTTLSPEELASIIPAIEVTSREYIDILCYFEDFASLEEFNNEVVAPHRLRPYMISLSCEQILHSLKGRKCVVTIPHPDYPVDSMRSNFMRLLSQGKLSSQAVSVIHCIEVFNASRNTGVDSKIKELAIKLNKHGVAGSDAHTLAAVANTLTFCKAQNHAEFLRNLATGKTKGIGVASGCIDKTLPKLKMAWLHIKGLLARH